MAEFNFHAEMKNTQIITEQSQGTQTNYSGAGDEQIAELMKEIARLLESSCTAEQNRAGRQVIQTLSDSAAAGNVSSSDEASWITKLKKALSIGVSVATITQESYWPKIEAAFHRLFMMIIR